MSVSGLYQYNIFLKAYLLEFEKNNELCDAFCFSAPPENEELSFAHRVNETKTFGGACIDDYGADTYKISLSGSTINQSNKFVYRSTKAPKYLTGEQEIFYLQQLLAEYADAVTKGDAKLYLYDLGKNTLSNAVSEKINGASYIKSAYRVYPLELKIKRSKDAPLTYNYSIDFLAHDYDKGARENDVEQGLGMFSQALTLVTQAVSAARELRSAVGGFLDKVEDYCATLANNLESLFGYIGVLSAGGGYEDLGVSVTEKTALGDTTISETEKIFTSELCGGSDSALSAVVSLFEETAAVGDDLAEYYEGFAAGETDAGTAVNYYMEQTYGEDIDVVNAKILKLTYILRSYILRSYIEVIKYASFPVLSRDADGADVLITAYGHSIAVWKSNSTLERIAYEKYGDADYAYMLARYNNILSEEEIGAGTNIYCPLLSKASDAGSNLVYSTKERIYGTDVKVGGDGRLEYFNGDLATVTGEENLKQAIETRLTSGAGGRIKDVALGIRAAVGGSQAACSYILASIERTLAEEARIESVDEIQFYGSGDVIQITVAYTDIAGTSAEYKTAI